MCETKPLISTANTLFLFGITEGPKQETTFKSDEADSLLHTHLHFLSSAVTHPLPDHIQTITPSYSSVTVSPPLCVTDSHPHKPTHGETHTLLTFQFVVSGDDLEDVFELLQQNPRRPHVRRTLGPHHCSEDKNRLSCCTSLHAC